MARIARANVRFIILLVIRIFQGGQHWQLQSKLHTQRVQQLMHPLVQRAVQQLMQLPVRVRPLPSAGKRKQVQAVGRANFGASFDLGTRCAC